MTPTARHLLPEALSLAMLLFLLSPARCDAQGIAPCRPFNVVIDGAPPDTEVAAFNSHGQGQVILVQDMTVAEIRFEVPAYSVVFFPYATLYVMNVDVNGRPIVSEAPVYTSQLVGAPQPTGLDPVPLVFAFDPPITLPAIGRYYFDVKEATCFGDIRLLGTTSNVYANGGAWATGAYCDPRSPGSPTLNHPNFDLLCDITYCGIATPASPTTWGELKVIYR